MIGIFREGLEIDCGAASPAHLSTGHLLTLAEVDAIATEWRALEAEATAPALFESFAWCRLVMQRLLAEPRGGRPRIVTMRRGGVLVAVAPLAIRHFGPFRLGCALGEPLAQYADVLVAGNAPWAAEALLNSLATSGVVDRLRLRRVRADAAMSSALAGRHVTRARAGQARHGELAGFADAQAFAESVDRKAARDRQRLERKLRAAGTVDIVHLPPGREAMQAAELAIRWKRAWLLARGRTSSAFSRRSWLATLAALVANADAGSATTIVSVDGEPVAIEVGFRHNRRHYAFLGAARPGFDRLSPTKSAMHAALADCMASGVEVYDLLGPDEPYKRQWCAGLMPIDDRSIALSRLGAIYPDVDDMRRAGGNLLMQFAAAARMGRRPQTRDPARL